MIAQTIQLALAPVFVLVAIGNIMNLLSTRLGRVVDRSRALQARYRETSGDEHDMIVREMRVVDRRIRLVGAALRILVTSGLAIGLTVVLLFLEDILRFDLQRFAAATFIGAIGLLMWALVLILRETQAASGALRIPEEFLERERRL
ncbi:DUF2721 domain-containing protein [Tsuneonella sp. SYSU-LHT278]|uniref:DUF2721 domain-containing protein n=1 Tax=Tsuneonella sediminis TaxID=3416089 RepID=UPI003F79138F